MKSKPLLLIVSSYQRPCGIAQYVEHLEIPMKLQQSFDVEILPLPVDLLRLRNSFVKKPIKKMLRTMIKRIREADVVSIQCEPGLFGYSPFRAWGVLKKIIKASSRVLITYHTTPNMKTYEKFSFFSRESIKNRLRTLHINYFFNKLFGYVKRNPNKFHHIVHTKKDLFNFSLLGLKPSTISYAPLSFLDKECKDHMNLITNKRDFIEAWDLHGKKLIGVFGFLSAYKGIEVAINAMAYLPEDYVLLVVGGLHPEGIIPNTAKQPYIHVLHRALGVETLSLADMAKVMTRPEGMLSVTVRKFCSFVLSRIHGTSFLEKPNDSKLSAIPLHHRVLFLGAINNNQEFNEIMAACDAVVLPYVEVGQCSSGPAAIALDMQAPTYCTRTTCFKELDKASPGILSFFELGNYIELAQKILANDGNLPHRVQARKNYVQQFNVENRVELYLSAASKLLQSRKLKYLRRLEKLTDKSI